MILNRFIGQTSVVEGGAEHDLLDAAVDADEVLPKVDVALVLALL